MADTISRTKSKRDHSTGAMFRTEAGKLARAVRRVLPIVEKRTALPILTLVRLRTSKHGLTVSGTDLDVQLDAALAVECVGKPAATTVDPRRLLAVLAGLGADREVEVSERDGATAICWTGGEVRLSGLDASDFPDVVITGAALSGGPTGPDLATALARALPFVSREETRYYLNGVCFDLCDGRGVIVATDGRRMGAFPGGDGLSVIAKPLKGVRPIVPYSAAVQWAEVASEADATITIYPAHFVAAGGGLTVISKLIDGKYPDWPRVLPDRALLTSYPTSRSALIAAAKLVRGAMTDKHPAALLKVEAGSLSLEARDMDGAALRIDLGHVSAPDNSVGIAANYLLSTLEPMRGETVTLWVEPGKASVTSAVEFEDSDTVAGERVICMPVREARGAEFKPTPADREGVMV